jgi:hypothetical protein
MTSADQILWGGSNKRVVPAFTRPHTDHVCLPVLDKLL